MGSASASQTHRIKRLLFELGVEEEMQAQRLHGEISQICQARIAPLMEQCLEKADADRLHRIKMLELDLGTIDPSSLETEMLARLEQELPRVLAAQLKHMRSAERQGVDSYAADPQIQSHLELLDVYARKGRLPWWAGRTEVEPLSEAVDELLHEAPAALARLMYVLGKDERALTRIVRRCDDSTLSRLGECLCASQAKVMPHYASALTELLHTALQRDLMVTSRAVSFMHAGTAASHINHPRQLVWQALLYTALYFSAKSTDTAAFWREVLLRLAVILGARYDMLLRTLHGSLEKSDIPNVPESLRKLLAMLVSALPQTEPNRADRAGNEYSDNAGAANWFTVLRLLQSLEVQKGQKESGTIERLRELADRLIHAGFALPPGIRVRLHEYEHLLRTLLAPNQVSELETLLRAEVEVDSGSVFNESEEAYVENAGLVILWPFLERFFGRLDLLFEKRFRDEAARQRAVGLLQFLVTEDPHGPEYLLPLNKVLCGMETEEVFDFGPPMQEVDEEECRQLLQAVIEHASILRKMSITGFRGSFLLRKGLLESRDGAWLLRVEKESYDVVLERFPWSFSWVKLPWMNAPLRVEW